MSSSREANRKWQIRGSGKSEATFKSLQSPAVPVAKSSEMTAVTTDAYVSVDVGFFLVVWPMEFPLKYP